ncbi:MAG: sigma-54-dependent Fis family transcriptional regulator, partial [Proteobacteria bacterium]|nr:sigma-54-dependent Fis family transcriptional regulator [Pseudomonadota bacterium]
HTGRTLFWETSAPAELISLDEMIQRYIAYILKTTKGNQSLASEILKIDRKTLYRRLQKTTE